MVNCCRNKSGNPDDIFLFTIVANDQVGRGKLLMDPGKCDAELRDCFKNCNPNSRLTNFLKLCIVLASFIIFSFITSSCQKDSSLNSVDKLNISAGFPIIMQIEDVRLAVTDLAVDNESSLILTGWRYDRISDNDIPVSTGIFCVKFDDYGNYMWMRTFYQEITTRYFAPTGIATDNENQIYILGEIEGGLKLSSGDVEYHLVTSNLNGYIIKLDENGDLLNAGLIFEPNANQEYQSFSSRVIEISDSGNINIAGGFENEIRMISHEESGLILNSMSTSNGYICELEDIGKPISAEAYGGESSVSIKGLSLKNNNVSILGSFIPGVESFIFSDESNIRLQSTMEHDIFLFNIDDSKYINWGLALGAESLVGQTIIREFRNLNNGYMISVDYYLGQPELLNMTTTQNMIDTEGGLILTVNETGNIDKRCYYNLNSIDGVWGDYNDTSSAFELFGNITEEYEIIENSNDTYLVLEKSKETHLRRLNISGSNTIIDELPISGMDWKYYISNIKYHGVKCFIVLQVVGKVVKTDSGGLEVTEDHNKYSIVVMQVDA